MASTFSAEQELLNKAVKQEKSASGGFSFFGGRTEKYEKAVDMYREAYNAYRIKITQLEKGDPAIVLGTEQAASAAMAAARICVENLDEPFDAINEWLVAFKLYGSVVPDKAAHPMELAIAKQKTMGRWRPAAQRAESLAEHYKNNVYDNEKAIKWYKDCLSSYQQDPLEATMRGIAEKLAELQCVEGHYRDAIELYEGCAETLSRNSAQAYSVRKFLFHAGICHLATGDMVATARALDEYQAKDKGFRESPDLPLLHNLKEAIERGDQNDFSDKLFQYDKDKGLTKLETTLFLRIKGAIEEKAEDFS